MCCGGVHDGPVDRAPSDALDPALWTTTNVSCMVERAREQPGVERIVELGGPLASSRVHALIAGFRRASGIAVQCHEPKTGGLQRSRQLARAATDLESLPGAGGQRGSDEVVGISE